MGPLASIRVLDLTRVRSGPTAVRQLADWGADVIKVEQPAQEGDVDPFGGGERDSPDFQNLHRNKRSLSLNLKTPEGVAILKRLVKDADVMVENYRPDVKRRLGIDYPAMREINPRLVYASISGFGEDGPYSDRPGFDQIAQGMGGFMSITGEPGRGPMRAGIAISDTAAGLYCALGIMTALLERDSSGEGQWVHISLLQAMIALLDFQAARWLVNKEVPQQTGNDHPTSIPTGVFETSDGHINIAAGEQAMWERLCHALAAGHLIAQNEFRTADLRSRNRIACNAAIAAITRTRTSAEWLAAFADAAVAAGPIYRMDEVFADPQVQHLEMAAKVHHPVIGDIELVAQPFALTRTPSEIRTATPETGEHTDEILHELGYGDADIADLRRRMVI